MRTSSIEALRIAGVSEREARVWHVLSTEGPLNISQLSRATDLHRPALYALLPQLIEKKLVKEVKGKRRVAYVTTGAAALEAWRAQHDRAFAKQIEALKKQEGGQQLSHEIQEFHGKDISKVWEVILKDLPKRAVFFRYDGYSHTIPIKTYIAKGYYEEIQEKGLERFVITNQGLRTSPYKKRIECASRMLPGSFDAFEYGMTQFICGNKIAMVDFTTESAYVITNAALAKYHARLFQYLYRSLPG